MARPPIALDVKHIVKRYKAGDTVLEIAHTMNVSHTTIQDRLRKAGELRKIAEDMSRYKRETMIALPVADIVGAYALGIPANQLARQYGVSRIVIERRLRDAGVLTNQGATGAKERAIRAEQRGFLRGSGEQWLCELLTQAGFRVRTQAAIGCYNVDALADNTVAVELMTCSGMPYGSSRYANRLEYILDRHAVIIVWSRGRYTLTPTGANHVITLAKRLSRKPAATRGQYWVIRGDGHIVVPGDDPKHVSDGRSSRVP